MTNLDLAEDEGEWIFIVIVVEVNKGKVLAQFYILRIECGSFGVKPGSPFDVL